MWNLDLFKKVSTCLIIVTVCLIQQSHDLPQSLDSETFTHFKGKRPLNQRQNLNIIVDNRPSDYEYAVLSGNIYGLIKIGEVVKIKHEEWQVIALRKGKNDYLGCLYKNKQKKQLVLVHRGTHTFKNIIEDLQTVILGMLSSQQQEAYDFTKVAVEYALESNYHLSSTGHSLGALLAELSVYWCHDKFAYYDMNAVTFESPGSRDLIEKKLFPNLIGNHIDIEKLDIVQYLSYPNLINTWGHHTGTVYQIYPMLGDLGWVMGWYTAQSHAISNIINLFEEGILKNPILMQDWPLGSERKNYFQEINFQEGKYFLKELNNNKEFTLYYKGHYAQGVESDLNKYFMLRHFNSGLREFLIDFFQLHKHLLLEEETKKALIKYWINNAVPENLIALIICYEIIEYRNIKRISLLSEQNIRDWRNELSSQLAQHTNLIPILLHPLKQDNNQEGIILVKDNSFIKDTILNTQTNANNTYRKYRGTPESLIKAQKEGFNPNCWKYNIYDDTEKKAVNNYLTIANNTKIKNTQIRVEEQRNNLHEEYEFTEEKDKQGHSLTLPWNTPYLAEHFVNRSYLKIKIQDKLKQHANKKLNAAILVGMHGLGGVGKTYLALDMIYSCEKNYSFRGWFNSNDENQLKKDYFQLGEALNLFTKGMQETQKINLVKSWLNKQESLFLVFDNVPNMETIENYLPQKGEIIITSRNFNLPDAIEIDVMEEKEAIELLSKSISHPNSTNEYKNLVKKVGYLPLAISQAAAYIEQNMISINKYLTLYHEQNILMSNNIMPVLDRHASIYITWNLILKEIQQKDKSGQALKLLEFCAFCNSVDIPKLLLMQYLYGTVSNKIEIEFNKIIVFLRQYSLLKVTADTVALHPLVQDCIRSSINLNEQKIISRKIIHTIKTIYPLNYKKGIDYVLIQKLLPHMEALLFHVRKNLKQKETMELIKYIADAYYEFGVYNKAKKLLEEILKLTILYYGPDNIEVSIILHDLGEIATWEGNYREAKSLLEKALAIQINHYGTRKNINVSFTLRSLGMDCLWLGENKNAKNLLEETLETQINHYGTRKHIDISFTLRSLGRVFLRIGDYVKAKKILEEAVEIQENYYNTRKHIQISFTLESLIEANVRFGNYLDAKNLIIEALEIQENYYGTRKHIDASFTLRTAGRAYLRLGDYYQAKSLLEEVLEIQKNYYGTLKHIEIALNLRYLVEAHSRLGDYQKARSLLKDILETQVKHYGTRKHTEIAFTLRSLSVSQLKLGDYEQAKKLIEEVLEIQKIFYDITEHIEIAITLKNLGRIYLELGDYQEAKIVLKEALKVQEKHYNIHDHIQITSTLRYIGRVYLELGDYQEAKIFLEKALKFQKKHYSLHNYIHIASTLRYLGVVYYKLKNYEKAKKILKEALTLQETYFGINHLEVAITLYLLAELNYDIGNLKNSLSDVIRSDKILQNYPELNLNHNIIKKLEKLKCNVMYKIYVKKLINFFLLEKISGFATLLSTKYLSSSSTEICQTPKKWNIFWELTFVTEDAP